MSQITVSIFMLTYNQENYIAQAMDSILMQETNFNYQLVIGEDYSTDGTRKICEEYANKYPQKVKLLPSLNKNVGLINNYLRTIKACDGKYIAICDGDDYWIDKDKLQKQVDFLEKNPDFYIVATNLKRLYSNGKMQEFKNNNYKPYYNFEDLIFDNLIASVTVLFKNIQKNDKLPNWINKFPYGDWPTYLWTIKNEGKIHFLDDITAVYRTDVGISSKIRKDHSKTAKINLEILECIDSDSNFSHKKEAIHKSLIAHKMSLMACYNREKQYLKAFKILLRSIILNQGNDQLIKFYLYSIKQSIKTA